MCGYSALVDRGGSLISTGESTLYASGATHDRTSLIADLLRGHVASRNARTRAADRGIPTCGCIRNFARVRWAEDGKEPALAGRRHPMLAGFDETDIIAFGGALPPLKVDEGAVCRSPSSLSSRLSAGDCMDAMPDSGIPGLVVNETAAGSRIAYLAADLDRRYQRELLPDHANCWRTWCAGQRRRVFRFQSTEQDWWTATLDPSPFPH